MYTHPHTNDYVYYHGYWVSPQFTTWISLAVMVVVFIFMIIGWCWANRVFGSSRSMGGRVMFELLVKGILLGGFVFFIYIVALINGS